MSVGQYQRQAPVTNGLPNVRYSPQTDPNAFGANVGQAVQGFGAALNKTGDTLQARANQMQQEINASTVLDLTNQWGQEVNGYLHDTEKGVLNLKGSLAKDATKNAAGKVEEINNKYLGMCQNEDQRFALKNHISGRALAAVESVSTHEAQQMQAWRIESKEGIKSNAINNVALKYNDQKAVYAEINAGLMAIDAQAPGHASEAVMAEKRQFVNDVHVRVYNQYIAKQDYKGARAWFDQHKGEILAPEAMEGELQKVEQVAKMQVLSKQLLGKYGVDGEDKAMAEIEKLYPAGPQRERATDYVRGEFGYARQQKERAEQTAYDNALKRLRGAKNINEVKEILATCGDLKGEHLNSLETVAKAMLGLDETGRPKHTPFGVWAQALIDTQTNPNMTLTEFVKKYGTQMADADLRRFSEKIFDGKQGMEWASLIKDVAPKVKEKDIPLVFDTVDQMENEFKRKNGRAPDTRERKDIVDYAIAEIIFQDGSTGKRYEADMPFGTYWDAERKMFCVTGADGQVYQVQPKK